MNKFGYRILWLLAAAISAAATGFSQDRAGVVPAVTDLQPRTQAAETFELNIDEKRITEQDFEASTSVGFTTQEPHSLRLQVGVGVRAQTIDVSLRNVVGRVAFRGSVQRIIDALEARRKTNFPP